MACDAPECDGGKQKSDAEKHAENRVPYTVESGDLHRTIEARDGHGKVAVVGFESDAGADEFIDFRGSAGEAGKGEGLGKDHEDHSGPEHARELGPADAGGGEHGDGQQGGAQPIEQQEDEIDLGVVRVHGVEQVDSGGS